MPGTSRGYRDGVTEPHRQLRAVDVAIAVILFAAALLTASPGFHGQFSVWAALLAAVACGATVWRRREPTVVFVVTTVTAEGYLAVAQSATGVLVLGLDATE